MAFPIDTSRAFLRPGHLEALVRAVAAADDHEEHDWIEWKTDLDLMTPEGRFHVVKQVLGFSNRSIATAQRNAQGHSYIVVGAATGAISGVEAIDPADIANSIAPYVGPVQWSPEWVKVDGKDVLVVIIDPPRPGDEPFTLRKGYDKHRAGDIFVRTPGRSERASPDQVAALIQRAKASTAVLDLRVRAMSPTIEAGPSINRERLEQLITAERDYLMASERATAKEQTATGMEAFTAFAGAGALGAYGRSIADERSPEDYRNEVNRYLDEFRSTAIHTAHHERLQRSSGELHLLVENLTLQNFKNVEVVVHIDGNVSGWSAEELGQIEEEPTWPLRPKPLGTPRLPPSIVDNFPARLLDRQLPILDPGPGFTAENSGSVTITFDPVDLRPKSSEPLIPVPLRVHEKPGRELVVTWRATADNVDGLEEGDDRVIVIEGSTFAPEAPTLPQR